MRLSPVGALAAAAPYSLGSRPEARAGGEGRLPETLLHSSLFLHWEAGTGSPAPDVALNFTQVAPRGFLICISGQLVGYFWDHCKASVFASNSRK